MAYQDSMPSFQVPIDGVINRIIIIFSEHQRVVIFMLASIK